jgi:uncharacterized DUF497 family protein
MNFEWDGRKAESNEAKHGVSFEIATLVFADPDHILFIDAVTDGEERWTAIGFVSEHAILSVIHVYRIGAEEIIRIISARYATRTERELYAENLG